MCVCVCVCVFTHPCVVLVLDHDALALRNRIPAHPSQELRALAREHRTQDKLDRSILQQ